MLTHVSKLYLFGLCDFKVRELAPQLSIGQLEPHPHVAHAETNVVRGWSGQACHLTPDHPHQGLLKVF
jgi:hypothetical protein